jgi:GNAT superfamily N-acetyltransferase
MPESLTASIRRLTAGDIVFGMSLKDAVGWNQVRADWERVLDWEAYGCFLALWEGQPAGTATTISYDDRFGWIGMVLVHENMRRRGIGRTLMIACLEYLDSAPVRAVKLDATPMGKPLYESLGFVDEYAIQRRLVEVASAETPEGITALAPEHLAGVCALDLEAFGADRSRVLATYAAASDVLGFVALEEERITGYAFVRPGSNAAYTGPWVAQDADSAERLLQAILAAHAGAKVCLDLPLINADAEALTSKYGFACRRELFRMVRGPNDFPGRTDHVYSIAGLEIG